MTFFKPKIIKSSYFEFQKSYIPQRKLKTHEIRIQLKKIRITATMMIILRGGTIEQLTFILSEVRAALAVTNLGCGLRQPHTEQI